MPLPLQVPSALYSLGQGDRLARLVMDFFEGLLVLTIKRLFDTESKKNTLLKWLFFKIDQARLLVPVLVRE